MVYRQTDVEIRALGLVNPCAQILPSFNLSAGGTMDASSPAQLLTVPSFHMEPAFESDQ